jgi:DNA-binding CsgD family transcriptional regulator
MFSEQAWAEIARSFELSPRELQIVRGVFDDRTEFAIATDLGISPHTVHTHFDRLHHKLAVIDRAELILCVMNEFLALTAAPESTLPSICANRTAGRCPLRS